MGTGATTILIVDDSPTVRLQLRVLLEEEGFAVVEATNGLEGLEAARQTPLAAIVADLNMPVMDGMQMVAAVRQLDAHRKTPIIVATTEASEEAVREGLAAGATAWIVKPLDAEVLLPAVRRALRSG